MQNTIVLGARMENKAVWGKCNIDGEKGEKNCSENRVKQLKTSNFLKHLHL